MLPLYSGDDNGNRSSFQIRQRASTPGGRRRRPPPNDDNAVTPDGAPSAGGGGGGGVWGQQQQRGHRSLGEVTISMPDDDGDDDHESIATTRSTPVGPTTMQTKQQQLSHRRRQPIHSTKYRHAGDFPCNDQGRFVKSWKIDYEYGLDDYHTVFRTPHFVTDAGYQKHLRGELLFAAGGGGQEQQGRTNNNNNQQQVVVITNVACANFCFVFSMIATILLSFFGFLLDTQALYIPGTLPIIPVQSTVDVHGHIRNQQVYEYLIPDTERLPIAITAYRTSFLYFLCTMLAYYYMNRLSNHQMYTSIPETSASLPTFVTRANHNDSLWQRMVRRVKRHARYRTKKQEKKG